MDNPVQVLRSTGIHHLHHNELRSSSTGNVYFLPSVLNCYAVPYVVGCVTPCCTPFARGYPC
ncbi:MAG: hypothetical protein LBL39_02820 [Planctomycetaceae bacterium]|nr:hypothetical protein [Planctomycetaceae bacterium]